jgi:hypothetical protein
MLPHSSKSVSLGLTLCVGFLMTSTAWGQAPQASSPLLAEEPANSLDPLTASPVASVPISDVALSADGMVRGRVLSANGKAIDGAQVVIRQGKDVLSTKVTDKEGQFAFSGVRPGVYSISTVQGSGLYRVWPRNIAPPSARSQALLMTQEPVMRAQFGGTSLMDWTTLGVGVAGLTVGVLSYDKINDLEDDVKKLQSP